MPQTDRQLPRVTLRPPAAGDVNSIFRWECDRRPGFDSPGQWEPPTHFDVWNFVNTYSHDLTARGQVRFMVMSDDDTPVGMIDLTGYDAAGHTADISIYIAGPFRGHGYATAAIRTLVADTLPVLPERLAVLTATVMPGNSASAGAFRAAGFRQASDCLLSLDIER